MPPTTSTPSKNNVSIPLAIIAAGAMVAAAVYFGGSRGTVSNVPNDTVVAADAVIAPITNADHILGNPAAAVTVIEYSDLECPFCKVFHATMHQLVTEYQGQVAWVYRHFPIAELHSKAPKEAEASECAAEQGGNPMFWKFADKVFDRTGSNNTLDPAELPKIAGELGLDVTAFNTCLSSGKYTKKIADAVNAAGLAGARGTPYSIIVNKSGDKIVVNGAEPYESVKLKIDSALKQ